MTLTGIRAGIFCWVVLELVSWWMKVSIKARIVFMSACLIGYGYFLAKNSINCKSIY